MADLDVERRREPGAKTVLRKKLCRVAMSAGQTAASSPVLRPDAGRAAIGAEMPLGDQARTLDATVDLMVEVDMDRQRVPDQAKLMEKGGHWLPPFA